MGSIGKLVVVGSEPVINTDQSADFAAFQERWQGLETRLENLYKKHDEAMSNDLASETHMDALMSVQVEVEQAQHDMLVEITNLPAKNVHDVVTKLEIWKSLVLPHGSEPDMAQQSDQLVNSVLFDVLSVSAAE